ncbi:MAG TPA: ribosome recycling factor [Bacteroidales bacterium]|nr:ribosome recycling factor [Bacteroidales bacterium]HOE05095.1 ribosome recycling factor [Bacteroidales bacterium]HQL69587.1 ribosome recycling factor [Bacteroidales bacterium]
MDDIQFYIDSAKDDMNGALEHLEKEFHKIRAGKASPAMLENIRVDYYGTTSPLSQVANVSCPDAKTIFIQPWDRGVISAIEKAIQAANLGFNPSNNGEVIRIMVPPLTEERRRQLVKQVKNEGENAKVAIRNHRRDAIEEFKKLKKEGLSEDMAKDAESKIHKAHEDYIKKVDEAIARKEKEIMTV